MVSRFDFTLGSVEAVVVGRAMDVDVRVFPLRIGNTTVDPVRFAKLARRVYHDLEERRLSVHGELNRNVRLAFELWGVHRVSVTATGTDVEFGELAVFAATDGAQAVVISQAGGEDTLRFSLMPDEELVRTVAGALPGTNAAPGGPLSISHREDRPRSAMAALRQAEKEFDEEETEAFESLEVGSLVRARSPAPRRLESDEERLEEIFAEPRLGGGYFTATGTGRHGERRPVPPVTWLDTESGRYLVQTTTEGSGTITARYVPAGFADVAEALRGLISAVY
ncbi:ESX secretion-associated protein EspG [Amycolatopsis alkalitolerans]|uniref:ESX secretion-associated protein EspG n=1 Tax=Amycolatopsis alkalitolerans TaxID=2547244 RepID=A0A5C4M882_9PSEU|nr:ESX secretion-associated protein EspG [Amycolatopsis alkalitolerans]TNC29677.1 ESX secretion-associated protein EspG [Amycolatopsis alkalitolerans]